MSQLVGRKNTRNVDPGFVTGPLEQTGGDIGEWELPAECAGLALAPRK